MIITISSILLDYGPLNLPLASNSLLPSCYRFIFSFVSSLLLTDSLLAILHHYHVHRESSSYLYRLLREELVKSWPQPLCSDSFSSKYIQYIYIDKQRTQYPRFLSFISFWLLLLFCFRFPRRWSQLESKQRRERSRIPTSQRQGKRHPIPFRWIYNQQTPHQINWML